VVAKPRCDQCRFWQRLPDGHQELAANADEEGGQCHRFPPVLNTAHLHKVSRPEEEVFFFSAWDFPVTAAFDWCGEFKPRET
jgi:hypothetical protein